MVGAKKGGGENFQHAKTNNAKDASVRENMDYSLASLLGPARLPIPDTASHVETTTHESWLLPLVLGQVKDHDALGSFSTAE